VIEEARAELGDQLRFVYRHFPLPSHPHSLIAAEAAEAAGAQGKFWEMYDLLYANQKQLDLDHLVRYAGQLDLDIDRFRHDLEQHTYRDAVKEDMLQAIDDGVNGTPTLFINGERYAGKRTRDALLQALR
jgi:protein-disulfide isomerase